MKKSIIVTIKPENSWGHYVEQKHYNCPECNIEFSWDRLGKVNKFCYNCGQELDWSEYYNA